MIACLIIAKCEKNGFFLHFILKSDLIQKRIKTWKHCCGACVEVYRDCSGFLVAVLFKTYLIKSCLEGVNLNGNRIFVFGQILVEMTEIL
jgi:hypothetical protein